MATTTRSRKPRAPSTNGKGDAAGQAARATERSFKREVSWQAETIDANAVQRALTDLWNDVVNDRREAEGKPRRDADPMLMRTRTINLIAIADTSDDGDRIRESVVSLVEFFPSRSVILVRRSPETLESGLAIKLEAEEFPSQTKKTPVRFETITVAAAGREDVLASVASPILLPELPDFLWYPSGSFVESQLFSEVMAFTDRLIVDTACVTDPSSALRFLTKLASEADDDDGPYLSDFAWTRLVPWRQMTAQFFDQASTQRCLETIEEVNVTFGGRADGRRSGLTAGLLMAGWLCTRLGWRAPGEELVRSRDGWKLTLRAGQRGRSREVILTLSEIDDTIVGPCLGKISIKSGGDAPGLFNMQRVSPSSVETVSEMASTVNRIVYVRNLDDARLLSLELRNFGRDPIYYEALAFAANLWPEGEPA